MCGGVLSAPCFFVLHSCSSSCAIGIVVLGGCHTAYSIALHGLTSLLVGLSHLPEQQHTLGPEFCNSFIKSQLTQATVFDGSLHKTVELLTGRHAEFAALIAKAKVCGCATASAVAALCVRVCVCLRRTHDKRKCARP